MTCGGFLLRRFGIAALLAASMGLSVGFAVTAAHADDHAGASVADAAARALDREKQLLLRGSLPKIDDVGRWVATLNAAGRWPDIDYADRAPGSWKTSQHLNRLSAMARCLVDPRSPLHDDAGLDAAIDRGLDDWIAHRYRNPNWWHNDIGVPMIAHDILVLMGDRLTGARRTGAIAILGQHGKAAAGGGANTLWEARLGLDYGLLTGNSDLALAQSRLIAHEIAVTTGEGVQSDGSFHQHGPHLQQFHYGGAFVGDAASLGWQLAGTPWALPERNLNVVADCILNGSQWMERNFYTVPGTVDRAVSREEALHNGNLTVIATELREALPSRAAELDALIARQSAPGGETPLTGFRTYPRSDFTVFHRPAFSFFLKTVSTRTATTEIGMNGENLKGQLLGTGDAYVLTSGPQYFNLQAVWDWNRIPGVTYATGAGVARRLPFVGALGDGTSGLAAMDYALGAATPNGTAPSPPALTAHKFWACEGNTVVCLIADLRTSGAVTAPVETAMDQCRMEGAAEVVPTDGGKIELRPDHPATSTRATPIRFVFHAGLAYLPLYNEPVSVRAGNVSGSWVTINRSHSPATVTMPVFLPVLEQGASPQGGHSGYAIVGGCPTVRAASSAAANRRFFVLRNEADCQAVAFTGGVTMAAFFRAGELPIARGTDTLRVDQPCLVLVREGALRVCDPTQKGLTVHVTWRGRTVAVNAPAGGLPSDAIR